MSSRSSDASSSPSFSCARVRGGGVFFSLPPRIAWSCNSIPIHQTCCGSTGNGQDAAKPLRRRTTTPQTGASRFYRSIAARSGADVLTHAHTHTHAYSSLCVDDVANRRIANPLLFAICVCVCVCIHVIDVAWTNEITERVESISYSGRLMGALLHT